MDNQFQTYEALSEVEAEAVLLFLCKLILIKTSLYYEVLVLFISMVYLYCQL